MANFLVGVATGALRQANRLFDEERKKQYEYDKMAKELYNQTIMDMYSQWPEYTAKAQDAISKYNTLKATWGDKVASYAMQVGATDEKTLLNMRQKLEENPEIMAGVPDFGQTVQGRMKGMADYLWTNINPVLGGKVTREQFDQTWQFPGWERQVQSLGTAIPTEMPPIPMDPTDVSGNVVKSASLQTGFKSIAATITSQMIPGGIQEMGDGTFVPLGSATVSQSAVNNNLITLAQEMYRAMVEDETTRAAEEGRPFHQGSVQPATAVSYVMGYYGAILKRSQQQTGGAWTAEGMWDKLSVLTPHQLDCLGRYSYSQVYGSTEPFDKTPPDLARECYAEINKYIVYDYPILAGKDYDFFEQNYSNMPAHQELQNELAEEQATRRQPSETEKLFKQTPTFTQPRGLGSQKPTVGQPSETEKSLFISPRGATKTE